MTQTLCLPDYECARHHALTAMSKRYLTVAIPSRRRCYLIGRMLKIFRDCYVFVAEHEIEDYARYVDRDRLVGHKLDGDLSAIRNFILDWARGRTHWLYMIDDDFVEAWAVRERLDKSEGPHLVPIRTTNPDYVADMVYRAARFCDDVDVKGFSFQIVTGLRVVGVLKGNMTAFGFRGPIQSNYGIREDAFDLRFDSEMRARDDADYTIRFLAEYGAIFRDQRVLFMFEKTNKPPGGLRYISSLERRITDEKLKLRYGRVALFTSKHDSGKWSFVLRRDLGVAS